MQWIDQNTWPRAEHFALFSGVSNPFYSTTFRVDVTNLYEYTKARGISFYYSLIYLVSHAINQVENFRYVLEEGKVGLLERRIPSFTDMKKGSDLFHIVTMACEGTMEEFCRAAREKSMTQVGLLDQSAEMNQLIYISCLPWVDLTGCTRGKAVAVNIVAILILSMPCVLGYNVLSGFAPFGEGTAILDLEDFIVSNNLLPLGSLVYVLFCTTRYGWGWKNFLTEANTGEGPKFPKWVRPYVTYIIPLIVIFLFVQGYWSKFAA